MAVYSQSDIRAMESAFKHLFNVQDSVAKAPAVLDWMQHAAAGIVEYEGNLKGERQKDRDMRMELYEVYDGQIGELVSYLRRNFRELKSLSKWEIIFKTYSEIMDVQQVIGQAESQVIFSTSEGQNEVPQGGEEFQMSQGTSNEEEPNLQTTENTQAIEEPAVQSNGDVLVEQRSVEVAESVTHVETQGTTGTAQVAVEESVVSKVEESDSDSKGGLSTEPSAISMEDVMEDIVPNGDSTMSELNRTALEEAVADIPIAEETYSDRHVETAKEEEAIPNMSEAGDNVVPATEESVQSTEETVDGDSSAVMTGGEDDPAPTSYENSSEVNEQAEQSTHHDEVLNGPVAEMGDDSRSGNVQELDENPLFNTNNNAMEENEMANAVDELLKAAEGSSGADPAVAQQVPQSNVSAAKADVKEAQQKVSTILGGEKDQRTAWTRSNVVTQIISTMQPAVLRRLADEGTVGTLTDPQKRAEAIANKLTGYVQLVSGRKGLTVDVFETLNDTEKYANVVPGETKVNDIPVTNLDKAKAIYALLKQVKQDPEMKVPAFIPANPSFPTKGYFIGTTPFSTDEFMLELMDNSNGAIYGEDSITPDGQEREDAVFFRLGVAKKTEKAQAQAITTQKVEKKVPVVRAKNKKKFVEGEKHVAYLFTQVDADGQGKAAFRAMLNVNGAAVAAGVPVYSLDDQGKKIVLSHDTKNNKDRYKTRQASVSVSVPVTKILKEFAPEFKGNDEAVIAAARWNVNMGSGKAQGNFGQIAEFSQTPVFDVFTQVYAGAMPVTGSLKNSKALAALKTAADQQAAADAADAAAELS